MVTVYCSAKQIQMLTLVQAIKAFSETPCDLRLIILIIYTLLHQSVYRIEMRLPIYQSYN